MRKELQETKKELRAIREGLGIESPTPPPTPPTEWSYESRLTVLICTFSVLPLVLVLLTKTSLAASGTRKYAQQVFLFVVGFPCAAASLIGGALLQSQYAPDGPPLLTGVGMVGMPVFLFLSYMLGGLAYDKKARQKTVQKTAPANKPKASKANASKKASSVRATVATINESSTEQIYLRTPGGKLGGPYRKEKVAKAIAAGQIPDGSEAATSPDGPWEKITLNVGRKSTAG